MVVLEAGACGKPVVAADIGGLNEAVVDGETGFLVEVRDSSVFAAAIVRLLSDGQLRRQFGENARRRVLEKFAWQRISSQVEHIYESAGTGVYR
jgi:glycosyltransferase involved in cell wall biosynthesis